MGSIMQFLILSIHHLIGWNALRQHTLTLLPSYTKCPNTFPTLLPYFSCTFIYECKSWEPDWLNVLLVQHRLSKRTMRNSPYDFPSLRIVPFGRQYLTVAFRKPHTPPIR